MSERVVAAAVRTRLGADALARLSSLRRRLWWRRAVRAGVVALAAAAVGIALVQLLARAFPFEMARWRSRFVAATIRASLRNTRVPPSR